MSYQLISEEENHYKIRHPDGSDFIVAKNGIGEKLHQRIRALKPLNMAKGGIVPGLEEASEEIPINLVNPAVQERALPPSEIIPAQAMPQVDPGQMPFGTGNTYFGTNVPMQSPPTPQAAPAPLPPVDAGLQKTQFEPETTSQAPVQAQESQPQSAVDSTMSGMPGFKEIQQSVYDTGIANAEYQKGAEKAYSNYEKELGDVRQKYQTQLQDLDNKIQTITKDVETGKIDPNRLWNNKSIGSKVTSAIALVLGGIGSGLTGKSNAALDVINAEIDRDVEAQKAEMGNRQNLLSQYMAQYKNLEAAEAATRLHLATVTGAQIQKLAARTGSQQAVANATMALGQLKAQYIPVMQKMAVLQAASGPIGSEQSYIQRMKQIQALDKDLYKDQEDKYIPGVGVAKVKPTDKDREILATSQEVKKDIMELMALATKGTTIPGTEADAINKTKVAALQLKLKNAFDLGVLSKDDFAMLDKLVANPGAIFTGRALKQLQATAKSIEGKESGILGKLGVDRFKSPTEGMVRVSNGSQSYMVPAAYVPNAQKDGFNVVK